VPALGQRDHPQARVALAGPPLDVAQPLELPHDLRDGLRGHAEVGRHFADRTRPRAQDLEEEPVRVPDAGVAGRADPLEHLRAQQLPGERDGQDEIIV
jgi:hypothetical protein